MLDKLRTTLVKVNKVYPLLYVLALVFCMRWDILLARSAREIFVKRLPLEMLCLLLGMGLACLISISVAKTGHKYLKLIMSVVYFSILYLALTHTGILWTRHTDLNMLMAFAVIIALLRIIEKNHIGIFATNKQKYLRRTICLMFAFFIVVDLAYKPNSQRRKANIKPVTNVAAEMLFAKNIQRLQSLAADKWSEMSLQERLDVLQVVVNIELSHLGVNYPVPVKSTPLGKNENACYDPKQHMVFINEQRLEYAEPYEMLTAAAHESYHAYQQRMVEVYNSADEDIKRLMAFRKLAKYDNEMKNYVNGKDDFDDYYNQTMEADARKYGRERRDWYYEKLKLR